MAHNIQISSAELQIVKEILLRYLPAETKFWVFGSRSKNCAKPFSDLDLALENVNEVKIDQEIIYRLQNDFEHSSLTWTVDVLDLNAVSEEFCKIIKRDKKQII